MKQKSIQPARDIPYAEGILMYNGTGAAIAANTLVKAAASLPTGKCLNMTAANVNAASVANGAVPLWITKHAVPAGSYGVVLPWAILTGQNTAAITAGNPAYLQDAGTGQLGPAVGTIDRVCGVCLVSHATLGAILIDLRIGGVVTLS